MLSPFDYASVLSVLGALFLLGPFLYLGPLLFLFSSTLATASFIVTYFSSSSLMNATVVGSPLASQIASAIAATINLTALIASSFAGIT